MKALRLRTQYALYRRFFKPELFWSGQKYFHLLSGLGLFVGSSSSAELNGGEPCDLAWKMSEFQKRVGMVTLRGVSRNASHRRRLGKYYAMALTDHGWNIPPVLRNGETTLVRFPLQVSDRDDLLRRSRANRIELGSWFETPLHPIPLEEHLRYGYRIGSCPVAETVAAEVINLPMHERLVDANAFHVIKFILSAVKKKHGGALSTA
jgi:dTDP-4-amino-4,6-dideoxygalactose transaminase